MEIKSKNKGFISLLGHPYNSNNKNKAHFFNYIFTIKRRNKIIKLSEN